MSPTDNEPKRKTNPEIVDFLKRGLVLRKCPILDKRIGQMLTTFELRTNFQGADYHFDGMWLDGTGTKVLAGATNQEYSRAKALASLLDDKCFASVEAWVVACRNALGDNIDTFPLAGCIFLDGQCVDDLIDAADAAAAAALAAKAAEAKAIAAEVKQMKAQITTVIALVRLLCDRADEAGWHQK